VTRHGVTVVPAGKDPWGALPRGDTYVSIDLDVLDPAFAPGVSHHEPGGLTVREVLAIFAKVPGPIVACDVVEFNPNRDESGRTAAVALKLVKELVGRMAVDGK
jgi:arginase